MTASFPWSDPGAVRPQCQTAVGAPASKNAPSASMPPADAPNPTMAKVTVRHPRGGSRICAKRGTTFRLGFIVFVGMLGQPYRFN